MKKKILILVFGIIIALSLTACQDKGKTGEVIDFSKNQQKKVELTLWMDDSDGIYTQALIDAFTAKPENSNILVKAQHMGTVEAREKLKLYGPSGNGADLFQFPHDHLAQAVLEDLVLPLSDDLRDRLEVRVSEVAMDIAQICYNATTKSFTCGAGSQKKLYAVPNTLESVVLFYNTSLITTPATTMEELIAAATAWKAANPDEKGYFANGSHWADSYFIQFIFSGFGWRPFGANGDDGSAVGFESQKMIDALTFMRTLKDANTKNSSIKHNEGAAGSEFENGISPYYISGPWAISGLNTAVANGTLPGYAATTLPTINGNETKTFAGTQMTAVYQKTKNPAAAIKFAEFLASDEAMALVYEHKGKLPALKEELLQNITGLKDDPILAAVTKQLKTSIPMPTIPDVTYYWGPAEAMVTSVWNLNTLPSAAVKTAEEGYKTAKELAGK